MIAGRDTTAGTLTSAVYLLATDPGVLGRLRAEIMARVGPSRPPTYEDIRNMKFLRAVINETLRLFPVVPLNVRYVGRAVFGGPSLKIAQTKHQCDYIQVIRSGGLATDLCT